ncbi:MAG: ABC transporter ATP-binding protein [Spirochaetales bacterium]|nr:ABC transporter ATP-binding protein [Spirochaetales bacterium]
MFSIVKRIMKLAGDFSGRLKWAILMSFFEGIFIVSPVILVLFAISKILNGTLESADVRLFSILVVATIFFRAFFRRISDGLQSGTGYKIFARERMRLGEHLKRLPMGYFSEGATGNVTAVVTSDIVFVEQYSMNTLSKIFNGYISVILGAVMMLIIDYRIALIAIATFIFSAFSLKKLNSVVIEQSKKRQEGIARLVGSVLEYVRGISVIKAFNMVGERSRRVNDQFKEYRDISINFEKEFIPPFKKFHTWFAAGISLIILSASWFGFNGSLDMSFALMVIIYIFQLFTPFQTLSNVASQVRIMERGLDRYDEIMNAKTIDENGRDIELGNFDIEFRNVSFAYENDKVLHDVSFKVPQRSMTALVGKSGCGKTTITNLVARFWDVSEGEVLVGGVNVRDMTCDSLLKNISMVFQNVYLFNDTILNNVRFGKPDASMEEVIDACKKARCHDFIMALEAGYETMVEEGGSSLSGGEKQRISIARAILKDAPIVLLDEATANVDPDNEKHIQDAISELVKDKTLLVIAHKLSTIREAEQILVIDDGRIIQQGVHEELVKQEGLYNTFWQRRTQARSWKISSKESIKS